MSKRAIRKIRHYKPALSFKQRVHMGMIKKTFGTSQAVNIDTSALVDKAIDSGVDSSLDQVSEHVHGDHCDHDGAYSR